MKEISDKDAAGSAGVVETRYHTFFSGSEKLVLSTGRELGPVTIAYETYGSLNTDKDNAVLVLHAFSGDAHAAGCHKDKNNPGWWDTMIGPGKAFDTDKYFIISSNVIGGCAGSTGPSSFNPDTGRPYGLDFPFITIDDMVRAQKCLVDHMGINKLLSVAGGSMGGMQVLQWIASYPDMVRSAIPIATTLKHSPQQIAFSEVGRQAIISDPEWNNGNYYSKSSPKSGLSLARMIGHITYMSDDSMEKKFSRKLKKNGYSFSFGSDFEVEGYLRYRGDTFVSRFDANSYLYITKAMDYFDLSKNRLFEKGSNKDAKFLVIAFKSDWLYPAYQSKEIIRALRLRGLDSTYCEIKSTYGHDAFLLESEEETRLIKHFLKRVFNNENGS